MSLRGKSELLMPAPDRRRCREIADILRQLTACPDVYVSAAECRRLLIDSDVEIPWTEEDVSGAPVFARPTPFAEWAEKHEKIKAGQKQGFGIDVDKFPEDITEDLEIRAMSKEDHIAEYLKTHPGCDLKWFIEPTFMSSFNQACRIESFVLHRVIAPEYPCPRGCERGSSLMTDASSWRLLPIWEGPTWETHHYHRLTSYGNLPRFSMRVVFRPIPWPQPDIVTPELRAIDDNPKLGYRILMDKEELKRFADQEPYPHLACCLISEAGPGDDAEQEQTLLRSELIAAFCMITDLMLLLHNHKHDIFPVFVYSFVGVKVRVLQVHHDPVRNINIVRKTSFLEIKGPNDMENVRTVVSWMLSKPCGKTRGVVKTRKRPAAAAYTHAAVMKKAKQLQV